MITTAVEQVINEMKAFPFTMITVLCLVGFSVYSFNTFADAGEIRDLSAKVAENSRMANKILKLQIGEALRSLHEQLCKEDDRAARRTLLQTIDELQDDYKRIDGARYPLKPCG